MASVTAGLRRTDDRVLARVPGSTPAALGFVNAAVVVAAIFAAVHGVGQSSHPAAGSPAPAGSPAATGSTVDGSGAGGVFDPAGGAAAGSTLAWKTPQDAAAAYVRAAAAGNCTVLSASTGKKATVRANLSPADFCKRERAVFHGFSVLKATRTSGSSTSAVVDVRVHGAFGTSDLIIRTAKTGNAWTVSSIS